jgi:hypothetical protein
MSTPAFSTNDEIELSRRTNNALSAQHLSHSNTAIKYLQLFQLTHFMHLVGEAILLSETGSSIPAAQIKYSLRIY